MPTLPTLSFDNPAAVLAVTNFCKTYAKGLAAENFRNQKHHLSMTRQEFKESLQTLERMLGPRCTDDDHGKIETFLDAIYGEAMRRRLAPKPEST